MYSNILVKKAKMNSELYFRAVPDKDKKWLKADVNGALENLEELSNLWNHLIQDSEVTTTKFQTVVNAAGNVAYSKEDGKYFCGAEILDCACCKGKFCSISPTLCSCISCQLDDVNNDNVDFSAKKSQTQCGENLNSSSSSSMLDKWYVLKV